MIPPHRSPHAAAHRAADGAAFRLRTGPQDWRELYRRRTESDRWTGWGLSGVLHVAMLLALAAALLPLDLGESSTLLVELSLEPEETPLDTFVMLPEEPAVDSDATGGIPDALIDSLAEDIATDIASATSGGGRQLTDEGDTKASPGKRGGDGGASGPRAEYFGTVAYGDRFVYILDKSGSMNHDGGQSATRYDRAADELVRSVYALRDDQWFYVIVFSDETRRMHDDTSLMPRLVQATPENKQALHNWLDTIQPQGNTDPREAIYLALLLKPSAVFLLSDGEFNGHKHGRQSSMLRGNPKVEEVVAESNEGGSPIHTIAYEDKDARENMYALAQQTGGMYRFIPRPGEPDTPIVAARSAPGKPPPKPSRPARGQWVPPEERAAQLLRLAEAMRTAGKPDKARQRYEQIARMYPQTPAGRKAAAEVERLSPPAE